ncbi:hypothetical protein [Luteolibacter luteus]|uniref:PEP-CTERM sorting domain-containing protein n=1 Tax=Luteolibacter luteus TaxID=2728835 RepID=A0A858RP82_9BACT|nr:hypothetical protein [Luteolibacter luteus]QJE98545.1 hypothetical protein HHL09_23095 [Luteolibacter luteus]
MNIPVSSFRAVATLLSIAFAGSLHGATVSLGQLSADYSGAALSTIGTEGFSSSNLSDLTGLTPGQSIQISFTPNQATAWEGFFYYNEGQVAINWRAQIEISVGGHTTNYTDLWTFGPSPAIGGEGGVSGSNSGPTPITHSLVVPWGTDLSAVVITIRDLSSISGSAGAYFTDSKMTLSGATLVTTSVPEPSGIFLGLMPAALLLHRRRGL